MVASYLTGRYLERANVARFWRTQPEVLRRLSEIEYHRMREFALRSIEATNAPPNQPPPKPIDDF